MLNDKLLDALPEVLAARMEKANEYMLKKAGEHIGRIGRLTASDIHRLDELRRASADIREIEKELAKETQKNVADIEELFAFVASQNLEQSRDFYKWRGKEYIPYEKNAYLRRYVQSISRQTQDTLKNLSQTTVLRVWKNRKKGNEQIVTLADGYKDIIDQAVTNVSIGVQDYKSAMRDTLRGLGESGIRTVEYESGWVRRLDSAVRMNLLEGIRQVNQGVQDAIGEDLGCDGVEISAHEFCSADHEDIQGRQMTKEQYDAWTAEHAYPLRKIGVLNCRHYAFRVILGVQEPLYTAEQLDEMKQRNAEGVTFEGKHYTMYEATQVQRELETRVRSAKDKQILAAAAGDDELRREAQRKINLLTSKYKRFSDAAGLSYKSERMSVSGFHRVSAK